MSNYGRNFEFRVTPEGDERGGRFVGPAVALIIGAPVEVDLVTGNDSYGRQTLKKSADGTARASGSGQGIIVYEYAPAAFAGYDPALTLYSDLDTVPSSAACQLVHGIGIKVLLRNTTSSTFLHNRAYTGRKMVAGLGGATPTIVVGDYLLPGVGDGTSGYWKETVTAGNAWLRVTYVDNTRAELEAELLI